MSEHEGHSPEGAPEYEPDEKLVQAFEHVATALDILLVLPEDSDGSKQAAQEIVGRAAEAINEYRISRLTRHGSSEVAAGDQMSPPTGVHWARQTIEQKFSNLGLSVEEAAQLETLVRYVERHPDGEISYDIVRGIDALAKRDPTPDLSTVTSPTNRRVGTPYLLAFLSDLYRSLEATTPPEDPKN